jgi:dTDP-4-amino-4,6-dideoxygalactose transaminase
MGLTALESLDEWLAINRANYETYREELAGVPGVDVVAYDDNERRNYQYVVIRVDQERSGLSRDDLVEALRAENVLARRYFYPPCHRMEPYQASGANHQPSLPVTEDVSARVAALPTGTAVGAEGIRQVCQLIMLCVEHGQEISRRLTAGRDGSLPRAV